eukprot:jgi/Ulvmu1/8347/UM042_0053.1
MGKTSKRNNAAAKTSPAEDPTVPAYGFEQFRGEGIGFYVRQLGGFVLVIIGTLIMCSSYTEDYWFMPLDKEWGPYFALAIICLGAVIHEMRPWKRLEYVRSQMNEKERQGSSAAVSKKTS